jgi:tetratricopeptide (TPR) repeat protein
VTSAVGTVVAAGGAFVLKKICPNPVRDAYSELRAWIFDNHPGVTSIERIEREPSSPELQEVLRHELEREEVAQDRELIKRAQILVELVQMQAPDVVRSIGVDLGVLDQVNVIFERVLAGHGIVGAKIENVTSGRYVSSALGARRADISEIALSAYKLGVAESAKEVRELCGEIGIGESAIIGFLETIRKAGIPLQEVPAKFLELTLRYNRLLESVRTFRSDDPDVQGLKADAISAIEGGPTSYDYADELLQRAENIERDARMFPAAAFEIRNLNAAAMRAQRGELSLLQLDYESAIEHFKEAAAIAPQSHPEVRMQYRGAYADVLYEYGRDRGIHTAREASVTVLTSLLEEHPRGQVPLDSVMTPNNLDDALGMLGESDADAMRLEEAVDAYRSAFEENSRERVPLDWAMMQNTIGAALWRLGERGADSERFDEAVESYRAALDEGTRERMPLESAMTQNNLGDALGTLDESDADAARLEEAVEAFSASVEDRARGRISLEVVQAYRTALREFTSDRLPLDWATTQKKLDEALRILMAG